MAVFKVVAVLLVSAAAQRPMTLDKIPAGWVPPPVPDIKQQNVPSAPAAVPQAPVAPAAVRVLPESAPFQRKISKHSHVETAAVPPLPQVQPAVVAPLPQVQPAVVAPLPQASAPLPAVPETPAAAVSHVESAAVASAPQATAPLPVEKGLFGNIASTVSGWFNFHSAAPAAGAAPAFLQLSISEPNTPVTDVRPHTVETLPHEASRFPTPAWKTADAPAKPVVSTVGANAARDSVHWRSADSLGTPGKPAAPAVSAKPAEPAAPAAAAMTPAAKHALMERAMETAATQPAAADAEPWIA